MQIYASHDEQCLATCEDPMTSLTKYGILSRRPFASLSGIDMELSLGVNEALDMLSVGCFLNFCWLAGIIHHD